MPRIRHIVEQILAKLREYAADFLELRHFSTSASPTHVEQWCRGRG